MNTHLLRNARVARMLIMMALVLLVAAGCGEKEKKAATLGMSGDAACTVHGDKITPDAVRDEADDIEDALDNVAPDVDADELVIDDYDGDLDPLELLGLDTLIEQQLVAHAASEAEIEISDDDIEEELEEQAATVNLEGDDLLDLMMEVTGLSKSDAERSIRASMQREAVFEELDDDDAEEFSDSDEYLEDELVPAADEAKAVKCGKGIGWDGDEDYKLETADGEKVELSALVGAAIEKAITGGAGSTGSEGAPAGSSAAAAKEYDAQASKILTGAGSVVLRFVRASKKLSDGKIGLSTLIAEYKAEARDMHVRVEAAKKLSPDYEYLAAHNDQLVKGLQQLEEAFRLMGTLEEEASNGEAAVEAAAAEANKAFTRGANQLDAWERGLRNDPDENLYPKIRTAIANLERHVNELE